MVISLECGVDLIIIHREGETAIIEVTRGSEEIATIEVDKVTDLLAQLLDLDIIYTVDDLMQLNEIW